MEMKIFSRPDLIVQRELTTVLNPDPTLCRGCWVEEETGCYWKYCPKAITLFFQIDKIELLGIKLDDYPYRL